MRGEQLLASHKPPPVILRCYGSNWDSHGCQNQLVGAPRTLGQHRRRSTQHRITIRVAETRRPRTTQQTVRILGIRARGYGGNRMTRQDSPGRDNAPDSQESSVSTPTTCATCGKNTLEERPANWNATSVRCTHCGAGGHVTPEGEHHGPAFETRSQTFRASRLNQGGGRA